jgi:hypothetical protein
MNEEEVFAAIALLRQQQKSVTEAIAVAQKAAQETRELSESVTANVRQLVDIVLGAAVDVGATRVDIVAESTAAVREVLKSTRRDIDLALRPIRMVKLQMSLAVMTVVFCLGIPVGWFASNLYHEHMQVNLDVRDLAEQIVLAQKATATQAKPKR